MTDIQIPAAMVEAVARSRAERECPGVWSEFSEEDRDDLRAEATDDLAAALGVCDVHEESRSVFADGEWSVWMPPDDFSHWRRWRASFREMEPVAWDEHRLSITTPAEQVDTEGAST